MTAHSALKIAEQVVQDVVRRFVQPQLYWLYWLYCSACACVTTIVVTLRIPSSKGLLLSIQLIMCAGQMNAYLHLEIRLTNEIAEIKKTEPFVSTNGMRVLELQTCCWAPCMLLTLVKYQLHVTHVKKVRCEFGKWVWSLSCESMHHYHFW